MSKLAFELPYITEEISIIKINKPKNGRKLCPAVCRGRKSCDKENRNGVQLQVHPDGDEDVTLVGEYVLFNGLEISKVDPKEKKNGSSNRGGGDTIENYPFFSGDNPVDFPFIADTVPQNKIQFNDGLHLINILNNKLDNDEPEYIDINSLVIPNDCYDAKKKPSTVPAYLKRNRYHKQEEEDDDVIFVKEYKIDDKAKEVVPKKPQKVYPEPRRNPKRQVQLQKVSIDLATKLTLEDYYEDKKQNSKESIAKKAGKNAGAIFSPPSTLHDADFKLWPVDGMHEKPTFNPVTKKIEKIPNAPKKMKYTPRATLNRKKPAKRKLSKEEELATNREFATLTHNTLHHVLSYVEQVKEFNELTKEEEVLPGNLCGAEDMLRDSCVLYSLANDVPEASLAKYIDTVSAKENLSEFLDSIINDCKLKK